MKRDDRPPAGDRDLDGALLARLGRLAAEDETASPDDQQLEALCAGRLDAESVRLLEARAAQDPELAARLAAYRPLDDGQRARMAEAIVRETAPAAGAAQRER